MNTVSYNPAPDCTKEPPRQEMPAWYLITSEEIEQFRNTLIALGNDEAGEGKVRIWELMLILDTVQDRLA